MNVETMSISQDSGCPCVYQIMHSFNADYGLNLGPGHGMNVETMYMIQDALVVTTSWRQKVLMLDLFIL